MNPAVAPAYMRLPHLPRAGARLAMRLQPLLDGEEDAFLDRAPQNRACPILTSEGRSAQARIGGAHFAAPQQGAPEGARSEWGPIIEPIVTSDNEHELHWLHFSVGASEIFLRPDDDRCDALGIEAARLIAWMPAAESLIARLERRFGASLVLCEPVADLDGRIARVRIHHPRGALRLAAHAADLPRLDAPRAMSAAAGAIRAELSFYLVASRVTSRDFGRLCAGACLLLAANAKRQVEARLAIAGQAHASGVFDLAAKTFEALNTEATTMADTATDRDEERRPLNGFSDAPVQIQIRLTGARVRFADLAALRPPALLPLEIEGQELEADIHANGRPYAQGRVVALGDAYGIVIDALYEEGR